MTLLAEPAAERPAPTRLAAAAPWVVLAAAVAVRLELFFHNRSFWLDESLLGLNLIEKSVHGLFGALAYGQSAPPGFLLVQKAALGLFGEREQTLRLFPLIASIVGLWFVWLVARRLLPPWPAVVALTIFAANDVAIYQSSEAKPYSSDVAVAMVLFWLGLRALDDLAAGRAVRAVVPSAAAGIVAVWISYPSVFVLGATFVALLARAALDRRRNAVSLLVGAGVTVGGSLLAVYLISSRSISSVQRSVFVGDTQPSSRVRGVAEQLWEAITDPGGFPDKTRGIVLVCVAVGVLVLFTRWSLERIVLVAGPTALAVVAALINAYPFGGRFSLFLVPYLTIVVALGVLDLVSSGGRRFVVGALLLLFVVAVPVGRTFGTAVHPPTRENVRPLLHVLDRSWRPGDTLYVYRNAQYALRFYAECLDCGVRPVPFPLRDAASGVDNAGTAAALASNPPSVVVGRGGPPPAQTLRSLDALRGRSRVWLLFSHVQTVASSLDEEQLFLAYLDTFGRRLGSWTEPGAALYLYDLAS